MNILYHYLKDRQKVILIELLSLLVWGFIFFVYRLSFDAFIYGCVIHILFVCFVAGYDIYQYYKQHTILQTFKNEANVPFIFEINDSSLKGQDYLEILKLLDIVRKQAIEQNNETVKSTQDYFTLWAHQMKLPIAALKLCLESDTIDSQECRTQLSRIDQYTDMVLAYLRMTSKQTDYIFRRFDLDELIHQAIRRFSLEFIQKRIRLYFEEMHQEILTDEKWFVFVLEQIISNAIKYSNTGSNIYIYVKHNELVIEDQGKGIDTADLERIFEKGYTGINGHIDKKATGLGLYLCKEICKQLACQIRIESQLHKGTKVILSIDHEELMPE